MPPLNQLINQLQQHTANAHITNSQVSHSSVSWHIHHCILVISGITNTLAASNPNDYAPKFSILKFMVLNFGKIPRGKGKSPEQVKPKAELTAEQLNEQIIKTLEKIKNLEALPANAHFKHPLFGSLNKQAAIRFLYVHTRHHLKIIEDIVK
jgi:hypothetical protein